MNIARKICPATMLRLAKFLPGWLACLSFIAAGGAAAQSTDAGCGNLYVNNFGPYDYRTEHGYNKRIVEDYHFTSKVENLVSGQSAQLGSDLDYTLRAFPNHHRALLAMMNLSQRVKSDKPSGAQFTVECYFTRALTFREDDQVARMLYAKFLATKGRKAEAMRQLDYTATTGADSPITQYNIGLLLFEMGEYEKSASQLMAVQRLGFEGKPLRDKLQAKGKWPASGASAPDNGAGAASSPAGPGS